MTFGEKIRESRITLKLTQKQLADKIGAKHNSISDWENDKNKPDPNTIELLCGVLNISPNYLLGTSSNDFSLYEKEIIKKYRDLDSHGKEMVDFTLEKEYERSVAEKKKSDNIIPMIVKESSNYEVNAAHADDYMNAPEELKQLEEDMIDKAMRPD